jgi:DNA-binding HxlR family transcriptional regulator
MTKVVQNSLKFTAAVFSPPESNRATCSQKSEISCPVQLTLELLGGRWKLAIIHSLYNGMKRFKELERDVTGVTPKMLTKQLKDLEANDIVHREYHATIPPTVEYSLTEYGHSVVPLVLEIKKWGLQHEERMSKPKGKKVKVR